MVDVIKDASFASARGAEYVCNAGRGAPSQPTITNHIKKRAATPANPYATTQRAILLGGSDEQQTDAVVLADMEHVFRLRSEEHTSELQSLMRISYAVFCLKKKNK